MSEIPKPIGHVVSEAGEPLTVYADEFSPNGVAFRNGDGAGPYYKVTGCPNCGRHAGEWWSTLALAAHGNAGLDPNAVCSLVCRYQLEHQADVASRRLTSGVSGATETP